MRRLLAVQFEIGSKSSGKAGDVPTQALQAVGAWISEWYQRRRNMTVQLPPNGESICPWQGHELSVSGDKSESVSYATVSWSYPDESDGNLLWHSRSEISCFNNVTEFSFQLLLESIQFYVAPVVLKLQRPRLVNTLLRDFECTCGGERLSPGCGNLSAQAIPEFVQAHLIAKSRRLPIVLVSRDAVSGVPLVNESELADRLAGIATVYVLEDKWAGFALTNEISKVNSCYNGAVRLYWPCADLASSQSYVYLPFKVIELGSGLTENIFRRLAEISAFRFVPGPVAVDSLNYLTEQKTKRLESIKKAAEDRGDYEELLKASDEENRELTEKIRRLQDENADLRAGQEALQANWDAMRDAQAGDDGEVATGLSQTEEIIPQGVEGAVKLAEMRFRGTLEFLEQSKTSARESPFRQVERVSEAFLAMNEVCQEWRRSLAERISIGPFDQLFRERGFSFKQRASMTSTGKWGNEYEAIYRGQKVSIQPHLTIGGGGPDTCLSIHFYLDPDERKFVVAHVGRHKTNTST